MSYSKIVRSFLFTLPLCLAGPAWAAADGNGPHSFKLGTAFGGNSYGNSIQLDLASPRLFPIQKEDWKRRTDVHLYVTGGFLHSQDGVLKGGAYSSTASPLISIGLLGQMVPTPEVSAISPYTRLGVDVVFPDRELSTSSSVGMRVSFGCDFYFLRKQKTPWLGEIDESFFVEGTFHMFHREAEQVTGRPRVLSGFMPQVGFRSHW